LDQWTGGFGLLVERCGDLAGERAACEAGDVCSGGLASEGRNSEIQQKKV